MTAITILWTASLVFNIQVIAEGLETFEHGVILLSMGSMGSMGCDLVQGYQIASPMTAEHILNWCHEYQLQPEWRVFNENPIVKVK